MKRLLQFLCALVLCGSLMAQGEVYGKDTQHQTKQTTARSTKSSNTTKPSRPKHARRAATAAATAATAAAAAQQSTLTSNQYCGIAKRCAWFLVDASTGTVLNQSDPDKQVYPASLTKMMTAYLLFEAIESGKVNLSDRARVSAHAERQPSLKLGVRRGDTISIEDALKAITVRSANDAAVIVAEALAGDEESFAVKMTNKARALGMSRTTFRNASGLPNSAQLTTARDMATLARRLMTDFPRYMRYFGLTEATVQGETIEGHNNLIKKGDLIGGKTGYIGESGFNMVGWSQRHNRIVIGAIFGGNSARLRDAKFSRLFDATEEKLAALRLPATTARIAPPPTPTPTPASATPPSPPVAPTNVQQLIEAENSKPATAAASLKEIAPVAPQQLAQNTFSSSWAVQVGAYRDETQAQQALHTATQAMPSVLGAAYPRTLVATSPLGQLYRAQLIGLTEAQAQQACDAITSRGMQCLTMPPEKR